MKFKEHLLIELILNILLFYYTDIQLLNKPFFINEKEAT